MTDADASKPRRRMSPRQKRYWTSLGLAAVIGGVVGVAAAVAGSAAWTEKTATGVSAAIAHPAVSLLNQVFIGELPFLSGLNICAESGKGSAKLQP